VITRTGTGGHVKEWRRGHEERRSEAAATHQGRAAEGRNDVRYGCVCKTKSLAPMIDRRCCMSTLGQHGTRTLCLWSILGFEPDGRMRDAHVTCEVSRLRYRL